MRRKNSFVKISTLVYFAEVYIIIVEKMVASNNAFLNKV